MDTSPDVLWDTKGRCQSVDCASRVGENGELGHPQIVADYSDII